MKIMSAKKGEMGLHTFYFLKLPSIVLEKSDQLENLILKTETSYTRRRTTVNVEVYLSARIMLLKKISREKH